MRPLIDWCKCDDWRRDHARLKNHAGMAFCIFCGTRLVKREKGGEGVRND